MEQSQINSDDVEDQFEDDKTPQHFQLSQRDRMNFAQFNSFKQVIIYITQNEGARFDLYIQENLEKIINLQKTNDSNCNNGQERLFLTQTLFTELEKCESIDQLKAIIPEFFLKLLYEIDNNIAIYKHFIGNKNNNQIIPNLFHFFHKLKNEDMFDITEKILSRAYDHIFNINSKYLTYFIELFNLHQLLFHQSNPNPISSIINNKIQTTDRKLDSLINYILFFYSVCPFNKDKFKNELNYKVLFQHLLPEKSQWATVKKLLKIYPEEAESTVRFYLQNGDLKQACEIAQDELRGYVSIKTINEIIDQSHKKSFHYHLKQYENEEIDFISFIEYFIDDTDLLPYITEKFCSRSMFKEAYNLLQMMNFDLNTIRLSNNNQDNLKLFLESTFGKKSCPESDQCFNRLLELYNNEPLLQIINQDEFAPRTLNCMHIDLNYENICFIDNFDDMSFIQQFKRYEIFGIDCEWKMTSTPLDLFKGAAIMQVACKDFVAIFDMLKLGNDPLFIEKFTEVFINKTFIGFAFNNDLRILKAEMKNFFLNKCKMVDIRELYSTQSKKNYPGLDDQCKMFLGQNLCKYEQKSNWERRPLRLHQLHYCALDAHVLVLLYEKLKEKKCDY